MEGNNNAGINIVEDIKVVFKFVRMLWGERKLYCKVCGCAIVAALVIAFSIPKKYTAEVTLAPEIAGEGDMGGLSSLASMAGISLGGALGNNDAIGPDLYPMVIHSKDYLIRLFDIPVSIEKGDSVFTTTYYDYLLNHQKIAWWGYPMKGIGLLMKAILPAKAKGGNGDSESGERNYMFLSEDERTAIARMQSNIVCSVDKKTGIITLSSIAQDPVVAAVLVDSARMALNQFIIEYRTNKAWQDYHYMYKLYEQAKADYTKAQTAFADFADSNLNLTSMRAQAKHDDLQNEVQLAYSVYNQMANQLQLVRAKIQENTPVYTVIDSATVPERASSPKKMLLMIAFVFLAFVGTTGWIFFRQIIR